MTNEWSFAAVASFEFPWKSSHIILLVLLYGIFKPIKVLTRLYKQLFIHKASALLCEILPISKQKDKLIKDYFLYQI